MSRHAMSLLATSLLLAACADGPSAPDAQGSADVARPADAASAARLVRTTWPSAEDPGLPFYARIDPAPPHLFVVDGWAVVALYRDPSCIPAGFDLLRFFDPPAAFGCAATVEGATLWHGAPFAGAPKVVDLRGTGAVPVWLVPADAALAALGDGALTFGELAAIPGRLTGTATHFTELLHPHPNPPAAGGGGHPNPKLVVEAQGTLEDGRTFHYHVTKLDDEVRSIGLRIR